MSYVTTNLKGHLALVTGGTGIIGKATCYALAKLGCNIAIHYHKNEIGAKEMIKKIEAEGVKVQAFQADLSTYDDTRKLHQAVVEALGDPTILFNNAGLVEHYGTKSIHEISIETFEQTWRANCGTSFLLTQLCMPSMESKGWGRLIFCSSVAGFTGGGVGPHYASSKSAMHGLIHWIARLYANTGITCNGVAPALVRDATINRGEHDELIKRIPMGRFGIPEEIAETVVWMVKTAYLTNKVITVDGGMYAY